MDTIKKIGFEIEGEWSPDLIKRIKLDTFGKFVNDGSISVCGKEDNDGMGILVCEQPENHEHESDCFSEPELTCDTPEGHVHTPTDCYTDEQLTCDIPEEHDHNYNAEDCYNEPELTCEIEEYHEHNEVDCFDSDAITTDDHQGNLSALEFNSFPYNAKTALKDAKKFFNVLQKAYGKKEFHANKSMGFHIHLSFDPQLPPQLFSRQFINYFHEQAQKAFPDDYNKRKDNTYCSTSISDDTIAKRDTDDRYHSINLWPAMKKHQTIEVRLWQAQEPKCMYKLLAFTVKTFADFLKKPYTQENAITITIDPTTEEQTKTATVELPREDHYSHIQFIPIYDVIERSYTA